MRALFHPRDNSAIIGLVNDGSFGARRVGVGVPPMTTSPLASARRIVVKTGSALMADQGAPRAAWLAGLAADVARFRARNQDVILVSSGAVALGRGALGWPAHPRLDQKQAAAAIGQPRLMTAVAEAFQPHGITVGQALLTLSDTETRRRWLNARATLDTLLEAGIVPVINENDTVATDEIRYGDNDRLAARVALSDVDGLYTADPNHHAGAMHIPFLDGLSPAHDAMATGANRGAGVGSGGMVTKLLAARIAHAAGCSTYISLGSRAAPLGAIEAGERATLIAANISPAGARAAWLAGNLLPEGGITVDAGAANALAQGASLLAVGITAVDGAFERGAAVAIRNPAGRVIAKGVTAYSAADIARIAGHQSEDMEAVLGFRGRPAIIHRDDLVQL
jgi:glutamate 5-kinase